MDLIVGTILFGMFALVLVCFTRLTTGESFFLPQAGLPRRLLFLAGCAGLFALARPLLAPLVVAPLAYLIEGSGIYFSSHEPATTINFFTYLALALGIVAIAAQLIQGCVRAITLRFSLAFGLCAGLAYILILLIR